MTKKTSTNPVEQFKRACRRYLSLGEGHEYIDVVAGVVFANRLDSSPLWMYLVGPASSGKTVVLKAMGRHPSVVLRDTVSPAGLISGYDKDARRKKKPLLEVVNGKMLIIKDFTTMLNMKYEDLHAILGLLRAIYDGEIRKEYATESIEHESRFGLIAAVTNAIDRHLVTLSDLGERFLCYRMPNVSETEERKQCFKRNSIVSHGQMEKELAEAACRLLDRQPQAPTMTNRQKYDLIDAAIIVAKARCRITRDKYSKDPEEAQRERAIRVSEQLVNLARGIAMARNKRAVSQSEIGLAQRAAIFTLPLRRIKLLRMMCKHEWVDVQYLMDKMHLSDKGARIQLDDLVLVELCERDERVLDSEGAKMRWRLIDRRKIARMLRQI